MIKVKFTIHDREQTIDLDHFLSRWTSLGNQDGGIESRIARLEWLIGNVIQRLADAKVMSVADITELINDIGTVQYVSSAKVVDEESP